MSGRLASGGALIDRRRPVAFTFDGKPVRGFAGDTIASALLGAGRVVMGRSFKYHRLRGPLACGVEEPNALVRVTEGGTATPNLRATTEPVRAGLEVVSQNRWPSLDFDVGSVNALASKLFPAGFYYKTFIHPRRAWKHIFEPVIRQAAGLGAASDAPDPDRYEYAYAHVDTLVVGGGQAGLEAAAAAEGTVLLVEQSARLGGRALVDGGAALPDPGCQVMLNATAAGVNDHGYVLVEERLAGPVAVRLWRIRARRIVLATGAIERPLTFPGNDAPGVMLASALRDYVALYGVHAGDRTVVVTSNDDAYRTALALVAAGLDVPAILDLRPETPGALPAEAAAKGIRILRGRGIAGVKGLDPISAVQVCAAGGTGTVTEEIPCDAIAMSGGWSPVVHLWSHCGGKLAWTGESFVPDAARPPIGADGAPAVMPVGRAAGAHLPQAGHQGVGMIPAGAGPKLRAKAFVDFQNDVKASDVALAAQEGFESVEHTKRYTTLGMATDQGKTSNINGLALLSEALGKPIPEVGTTTFRPPYTPVSLGAVAGEAKGALFKPLRKTPIDPWLDAHGAEWEPVADWRRPYAIRRPGEGTAAAIRREVLATRGSVGALDASTLGKLLVNGPDAALFLDRIYTNKISTLKVGRCRYGLMCTENGFLFDDGVVARLTQDSFLVHTTSGGADRVHAWLEEWLQTEWWDLRVYVANLTEQFAQIAVVGPKSREVLHSLGGMDLSGLAFMGWAEGALGSIPARVFRISFSGELSYEVAVPAGQGLAFWERVMAAGEPHGITAYGTEALHVMRAEKGFIMIGDETDGTVTPQDLGLHWAVSQAKPDFVGKRAMERSDLTRPDRPRLVGLLTDDPKTVLPDGGCAIENGRPIGHVTSTYMSPTLGRSIAMALIEHGPERMGDRIEIPDGRRTIAARIANPVFYDPENERQNV